MQREHANANESANGYVSGLRVHVSVRARGRVRGRGRGHVHARARVLALAHVHGHDLALSRDPSLPRHPRPRRRSGGPPLDG